jgi:glycosyltransferase involved in cell wall biosynthesis
MTNTRIFPGQPIFINARFLCQPLTGVQRYSLEILRELDSLAQPGQFIALCPAPPSLPVHLRNIELRVGPRLNGNLWEQIYLPWKTRGALLFSPANVGPFLKRRQVVVMHDMSVFVCPQAYTWTFRLKYRLLFKRLANSAERILTVSEFSKSEITRCLGVPPVKITVIHEGREHMTRIPAESGILPRLGLDGKPFFLVIGSFSRHKNLQVTLDANALLDRSEFQLVLVGSGNPKIFQPAPMQPAGNLVLPGRLTDGELKALYQHATALIFPSLYEGFGLPLLEAMACGCPVLSANIPSSREVCADTALYFNPRKPEVLANTMTRVLGQPTTRTRMRKAGCQRAEAFSWRQSARQLYELINALTFSSN